MLEINNDNIFTIKNTVSIKNMLNKSFFILDSDTGKQYNLTEVEYDIIILISKLLPFGKIVDIISSEYNVSKEQIKTDLVDYFNSLLNEGIIIKKSEK